MKVTKNKVTKVTPATAKAAKTAPAAKAEKVTNITASKYKGVTTGMRVMEYQDSTFAAQAKRMLTDEELVADWKAEFPNAVAFTVAHVGGARRDYNNGRHSKAYLRPERPVDAVAVVAGKRVWASTVEAAPKTKATKTEPKAETKPTAKPAAKVARRPLAKAS